MQVQARFILKGAGSEKRHYANVYVLPDEMWPGRCDPQCGRAFIGGQCRIEFKGLPHVRKLEYDKIHARNIRDGICLLAEERAR